MTKDFTVLVIDDDKLFCSLLVCLAERDDFIYSILGYKLILSIFDDMDALDTVVHKIKSERPALVLLDYFLGPKDCVASLDILEKIIKCCADHTDIAFITGMHPKDVRLVLAKETLVDMGLEIIQKPFGVEELLGVVINSIRKKENA